MPPTVEELLFGFLSKTLNMDETALKATIMNGDAIADDALPKILALDVERTKKLKGDTKTLFDNGYKKAEKEVMENLEKQIREEFSLDSELQGLELVRELVTKKGGKATLKDEEVKIHPLYLDLEKRKNAELKTLKDTHAQELTTLKTDLAKTQKLQRIRDDAKNIFVKLNPIVSENATVAANRERDFFAKFDSFDYEVDSNGNHLILNNGQRLEDGHGNPVLFENFVKEQASLYYDFKKQEDRGGAGNDNADGGGAAPAGVPKTEKEYLETVSKETDPKKRIEIQAAYYKSIGKELPPVR